MAGISKDVELIFKGTDQASPTIKNVRKSVADLTGAIQDQLSAADKGEGSINDLAKAYSGLKAAQGDVGEIAKIAAAYEKNTSALAAQSQRVADAKAKLEELNAAVAAAENPTKRLTAARDAAQRKLDAALAKEQQLAATVKESGSALDAAGGNSADFAQTLDLIRTAALETARALRDAAAAKDSFAGRQAAGQGNNAATAELEQFNKLAAGSGLPQAQIQYLSTLDNKLQALNAAIREDQASMAALNAELADRGGRDAAARAAAMKTALDEAAQSAERLKAATAFKSMAAEIEAGARDISRFGAQTDTASQSAQRFADTIQAILNPTQAASATLEGLDSVITQAEGVTEGAKRRMSEYNAELNNLQSASAGISSISKLISDFEAQQAAVNGAQAAMEAAQAEVLQLSQAIRTSTAPTQEMANALKQAEANLENAGRSFQTESAKLNTLDAALKKAGVDTHNLANAQAQLTTQAERAAAAQAKVSAKTSGKGSFLGLRPDEMTNLGYQINDIVVSLASGQAPLRVLAQQGAQIGQIIPGAFSAILRFAGPLAGLAAVLFTVGSAMKKASDDAARLEMGAGIVTQLGNASATSATQFAGFAKTLEDGGVKAEDTRKALVQLAADGLNTDQMEAYIATAKAVADVTGADLKDALEQVRTSFQGGFDDIVKLQEATGVYSDAELELIQNLFDQGKADEARTTALQIYESKMQAVADQQKGSWKTATEQLSQAWQGFLGWLNNTQPLQNMRRNLADLAKGAAFTAALVNAAIQGKGLDAALEQATRVAIGIDKSTASSAKPAAANPNRSTPRGKQILADDALKLQLSKARTPQEKKLAQALIARAAAEKEAEQAGLSTRETQLHMQNAVNESNAKFDEQQGKRDASAERRREAAARAAQRRAAAAARAIANEAESIQRGVESLNAAVDKKSQNHVDAIREQYAKLFRDIDEFAKKTGGKGLINGVPVAEVKAQAQASEKLLENYAQLQDYEQNISDLESQRKDKLDAIADRVARGIITPDQGIKESNALIDDMAGQIEKMASDALVFAQAMESAHPSKELEAFIAKMQAVIQNNSGGANFRAKDTTDRNLIESQTGDLNKLTSERDALIQRENNLVQAGLETYTDAQKKIAGYYADTNGMIQNQIDLILKAAEVFKNGTPEQQLYYKSLQANLANVSQEAQGVNTSFVNLKTKITDILTTNIVGFIDSVAQSFAKLLTKQESVMGFLTDLGRAFIQLIANVLQTVATLIIEALVLDAVDKATGGILKPLLQMTAAAVQIRHEGGIINGSGNRSRNVNPAIFAGAPKYHTGGIAGLAPDEHAAILRKGEEVLTEDNPRHRNNMNKGGSGGGGDSAPTRAVLAVGDDEIAAALMGPAGERVVMYHMQRNRGALKQAVNS